MNKKAQMQMAESIAIIIVIMIILIMGLIFYGKYRSSAIQEKKVGIEELDIVKLSQIAYLLPETQCSFAEVIDYGCIDLLKLDFLSKMIRQGYTQGDNNYFYYNQLFGTSKIWVQVIDNTGKTRNITLYESNHSMNSTTPIMLPVIVYDPTNYTNSFGVLTVEKYS